MCGRFALVGLLAGLSIGAAQAAAWTTYRNARFGTTAQVPADWRSLPPPANGDGLKFRSPNGRASITVSGIFNIQSIADETAMRLKPDDGETITYKTSRPGIVVVSGTKGERIFYRKSVLTCAVGVWNDLSIDYPAADKAQYDAMIVRVAASLHGGRGTDYIPSVCKR